LRSLWSGIWPGLCPAAVGGRPRRSIWGSAPPAAVTEDSWRARRRWNFYAIWIARTIRLSLRFSLLSLWMSRSDVSNDLRFSLMRRRTAAKAFLIRGVFPPTAPLAPRLIRS
jgi:hypothetical protein